MGQLDGGDKPISRCACTPEPRSAVEARPEGELAPINRFEGPRWRSTFRHLTALGARRLLDETVFLWRVEFVKLWTIPRRSAIAHTASGGQEVLWL